ncbi:hypothetical protein OB446_026165, partial [Paenibacillus alvei]
MRRKVRKLFIHAICLLIVASSFPFVGGKIEARSTAPIPTLNAYQKDRHVKLEWAVEMAPEDVMTQTSFEPGDIIPDLRGGGNTQLGKQSIITSNEAASGSRFLQVIDTVTKSEGNFWWYPETKSTVSGSIFPAVSFPNGSDLSVTFRARNLGGSGWTRFDFRGEWLQKGMPFHDNNGQAIYFANSVDFTSNPKSFAVRLADGSMPSFNNGQLFVIVTSHNTDHNYGVKWYMWDANNKKMIEDPNGTVIFSTSRPIDGKSFIPNTDTFNAGDSVLQLHQTPTGTFSDRYLPADAQWHTYSLNTKLDSGLYNYETNGIHPLILWATDGIFQIDDVKFGYATEVEVYRDGQSVYRGFLSDFEDTSAVDNAAPNPVSNVQVKIGSDRKPIITWGPATDNGTTYNYTIKGISRNGETPLSTPKSVTVSSGIKGYAVAVDTNPNTIPTQISTNATSITAAPQNHSFYVHVSTVDYQGNVSSVAHIQYEDKTAPQLNVSTDHTYWSQGPVTITATAADYETGLKHIELPDGRKITDGTAQFVATANGQYTFRAEDNAGNVKEQTIQVGNIDKLAPTITITPAVRQWDSVDIAAEIHYSDTQSGVNPNTRQYAVTNSPAAPSQWKIATADLQHVTLAEEGQWYLHAKAADHAGNAKQVVTQALQLQHMPKTPNFHVTSVEENLVSLEWDLPAGSALTDGYEYEIENMTTGRSWTVAYPQRTLIDQDVKPGMVYEYRMLVKNHVGSSAYTVPVSALTLPAAVKGLSVSPIGREAFAG